MTLTTGPRNLITDVSGIAVGQAADETIRTGVTVIVPADRAACAVDTRGGAPGTRETDALQPSCLVDEVDAVFLSGGSVHGLDAGSGLVEALAAQGKGVRLVEGVPPSPVVPGAILFDMANGGDKDWAENPYRGLARQALAQAGPDVALGNAGAGYGARAGGLKGGTGSASFVTSDGFEIGALMAANPLGSMLMPGTDTFWAWPFERDGEFGGQRPGAPADVQGWPDDTKFGPGVESMFVAQPGGNTSIGLVATNADLTVAECQRVAIMAHDGLARAVRPVHTPFDGDTIFVLATGRHALQGPRPFHVARLGNLAADCVARAMARGVYEAATLGDAVSYRDTKKAAS